MKVYHTNRVLSTGDYFLRGKIIDIAPTDDRYFILTLRYKTVSDKRILVWLD